MSLRVRIYVGGEGWESKEEESGRVGSRLENFVACLLRWQRLTGKSAGKVGGVKMEKKETL